MLTGGAAGLPWNGRRRRRFGRTAASLVHVIQHDVDQKVCRIVDTSSLDCKAAQVVRETVPSIELAEVDIVNLESRDIFESMQRYCTVERELLKPAMRRALWSGASLRHGIFVNAEYRYLMSSSSRAFCFSFLASLIEDRRRDDHNEDMPDITLRMLETECIESRSEGRCLSRWVLLRNDT
jgi:hypothetical protein